MLDENLDENLFYNITLPLDIPNWGYGWKIAYLAKGWWPLTLNFDPYHFMSVFQLDYSGQSFPPNFITTEHS